jgi:hypothetical protein
MAYLKYESKRFSLKIRYNFHKSHAEYACLMVFLREKLVEKRGKGKDLFLMVKEKQKKQNPMNSIAVPLEFNASREYIIVRLNVVGAEVGSYRWWPVNHFLAYICDLLTCIHMF